MKANATRAEGFAACHVCIGGIFLAKGLCSIFISYFRRLNEGFNEFTIDQDQRCKNSEVRPKPGAAPYKIWWAWHEVRQHISGPHQGRAAYTDFYVTVSPEPGRQQFGTSAGAPGLTFASLGS